MENGKWKVESGNLIVLRPRYCKTSLYISITYSFGLISVDFELKPFHNMSHQGGYRRREFQLLLTSKE